MVKSLTLGVILVAATSVSAGAQNRTTVEERPAITVPLPVPGIEVERRDRVELGKLRLRAAAAAALKTVRKEGPGIEDCYQRAMRLTNLAESTPADPRHRLVLAPTAQPTPLRFANPSSSGWMEDFHLQAVDHARHTEKAPR
jgi:hypothetical protein